MEAGLIQPIHGQTIGTEKTGGRTNKFILFTDPRDANYANKKLKDMNEKYEKLKEVYRPI